MGNRWFRLPNEKPDRSAQMRIAVRPGFGVSEPHQAAVISLATAKPRTRIDVSSKVLYVGERYFFFFLPIFFLAFFAFLAMLPSTSPEFIQCKSTLDVHKHSVHHN